MNPHRSFSRYPLAQLATAFSAGICASDYLATRLAILFIAGVVCALITLIAGLKHRLSIAGLTLLVATAFAGATLAIQEKGREQSSDVRQLIDTGVISASTPLLVSGVLYGPPEFGRDWLHLTLCVERMDVGGFKRSASGVVSLLAPFRTLASEQEYRNLQLRYGTRIRIATTLSRTNNYQNPGVSLLSEYLDREGYDATGMIKSAASITQVDESRAFTPLLWLYSWREKLQREIDTKLAPETAGVLDAALLGNRHNLSHATSERFREGGTFHVLVISGLHISFIGAVVYLVMKRLTRRRLLQFAVPAIVVWSYSLAVGGEASVVRAALMFTFAGVAVVLFREATSLNGLGAAALVLLIHSPKEISDPSFQLTFLSVLAIVVIAWPLLQTCAAIGSWYPTGGASFPPSCSRGLRWFCELLFWSERDWRREVTRSPYHYHLFKCSLAAQLERYQIQRLLRYVVGAVVVSGAVQLLLLPLMIVYFHRLSVVSLLLNIAVSVLLALLAAIALLALIVSQFSASVSAPLFQLANTINWLMVHAVDPFTHFNLASIRLPEYSGWGAFLYVLFYVPLLALAIALARWRPLALPVPKPNRWVLPAAVAQVVLLAVLILHPFSALTNGRLRIDFLDVGQGDAALVTMPDGRTLLVDGGGTPNLRGFKSDRRSIGEMVVSEYLWWRGLDTIDYVLATHADADHIDGLNDVLRNFSVQAALVARKPTNDPEYTKFSETIFAMRTPLATIQAADVIHFGKVEVQVLWPRAANDSNDASRNNDSIVLLLKYGERSILLTGDIEKSAENALVASRKDLQADVIKVPHHGSRSSSTQAFVTALKARFAIVSAGKNSMFGHPHSDVVERWQASGTQVLTTGRSGRITVTTDGHDLSVQPQENTKSRNE